MPENLYYLEPEQIIQILDSSAYFSLRALRDIRAENEQLRQQRQAQNKIRKPKPEPKTIVLNLDLTCK